MILAASVLATLALQQADPLAPARAGQVLCYEPDLARHTCYGTASYRWLSDGTIISDLIVAASNVPAIFVHSSAPVFVRDDAECTRLVPSADQITAIYEDGERLGGSDFESFRRILGSIIDRANGPGGELCPPRQLTAWRAPIWEGRCVGCAPPTVGASPSSRSPDPGPRSGPRPPRPRRTAGSGCRSRRPPRAPLSAPRRGS